MGEQVPERLAFAHHGQFLFTGWSGVGELLFQFVDLVVEMFAVERLQAGLDLFLRFFDRYFAALEVGDQAAVFRVFDQIFDLTGILKETFPELREKAAEEKTCL